MLEKTLKTQLLENLEGNTEREKWEDCARQFPWYPMSWLMLANTAAEKQKAAIWFRNEHRVHWLLNNQGANNDPWLTEQIANLSAASLGSNSAYEAMVKGSDEETLTLNEEAITEEIPTTKEDSTGEKQEPDESLADAEDLAVEEDEQEPEALETQPENPEIPGEDAEILLSSQNQQTSEPADNQDDNEINLQEIPAIFEEDKLVENETDRSAEEEKVESDTPPSVIPALEAPAATEEKSVETPSQAESTEPTPAPTADAAEIKTGDMLFEPLFAVDYFASQGIKVDLDSLPKTRFDIQVKSFTQWLKTMKRVPAANPNLPSDPLVDAQASASVLEKDVVTEAMAEVLEMQGKYKKAIEILEKLILLHPEKSTFFAARIENLKEKQ